MRGDGLGELGVTRGDVGQRRGIRLRLVQRRSGGIWIGHCPSPGEFDLTASSWAAIRLTGDYRTHERER